MTKREGCDRCRAVDRMMWYEDRGSVLLRILEVLGLDDLDDARWDKLDDILEPYTTGDYANYN